ncbi:hypothetical protein NDU88_006382 [Pleurodeles waltl]|uniref:Uncharacterized protein n=1 Tax=Pleurodeles waltl TaxID=8319 RepID=A0AAV7TE40_PLEWA|nr:hypothetical protein NDU88_006382 [Pleurodeles waltl]
MRVEVERLLNASLPRCCRALGGPLPAGPGLQVPRARSNYRAPDGVRAVRGALLARATSLTQTLQLVAQGLGADSAIAMPPLYVLRELLAPWAPRHRAPTSNVAFAATAPFHIRRVPRVRSQRVWVIKPPLLRFESRGSRMPPRSPLIESDYPDAVRSSRSSRLPCLALF